MNRILQVCFNPVQFWNALSWLVLKDMVFILLPLCKYHGSADVELCVLPPDISKNPLPLPPKKISDILGKPILEIANNIYVIRSVLLLGVSVFVALCQTVKLWKKKKSNMYFGGTYCRDNKQHLCNEISYFWCGGYPFFMDLCQTMLNFENVYVDKGLSELWKIIL